MAGTKLLIELYVDTKDIPLVELSLSHIVHGFKKTPFTHPDAVMSGRCNINTACPEGRPWSKQTRSVVMLLTRTGSGYCSGSMVNNLKNDGRQLFLTAFHCVGRDVSKDIVMFNYQANRCNDRQVQLSKQTAQGLKSLRQFEESDYAIFEVEEQIPDSYQVYLSGWSAQPLPFVPQNPVGIHHPSADSKKISFALLNASQSCWGYSCSRNDHWKIDRWSKGTTEPGSSGSPLFDSATQRIVGQLHGGSASCSNKLGYDVYGKLAYSFDKGAQGMLKDILDPENTGKFSQDGVELAQVRLQESFVLDREEQFVLA